MTNKIVANASYERAEKMFGSMRPSRSMDQQNRTIQQVTPRILAETFEYAIVFKTFTKQRDGRLSASRDLASQPDKAPRTDQQLS